MSVLKSEPSKVAKTPEASQDLERTIQFFCLSFPQRIPILGFIGK
jgi:hypothetical protein